MAKAPEFEIPAPRENVHLLGHEAAQQRFVQDFASNRLHHAYLITGPKGIGKATFAYRLARYVLGHGALSAAAQAPSLSLFGDALPAALPTGPDINMGQDDPLFRRIAGGSHTDLLTLSPAYDAKKHVEKAQISAEEARKVPGFMSLTPAEGAWRVVIVDAVDQLNTHAANALLKILEEPPENALLLLVCHEPGAILPTIRSRCRLFALQPPDRASFDTVLQTIAPQVDIHDYSALYALSYASPGLAITLSKHKGLVAYAGWLAAMQPDASEQTKQAFAAEAASIKSPEGWAMLLHSWESLMHRLSLYPNYDRDHPITRAEEGQLSAIAAATGFAQRQRWMASARALIRHTDTFNLEKKASVRLMLEPSRLIDQFPAAA
jgi:DNA polymerase-3 subunit delta'